ncbi:MAG: hypothetical protein RAK21_03215 [Synechococcus sp. SP2 MAG]|nr:hypothetical protein [Synechococcus sp. SP2 MAG]
MDPLEVTFIVAGGSYRQRGSSSSSAALMAAIARPRGAGPPAKVQALALNTSE